VLIVVASATSLASCGRLTRRAAPAATPPVAVAPPSSTDSAALAARRDSAGRDTLRADSLKRDSLTRDAAAAKDTAAVAKTAAKPPAKKPPATRNCVLDFTESPPETRFLFNRINENTSNTFIGGGFIGHCQGEKNRIRADSAEQFQAAGIINLYGNVMYEEPGKMQITALHATYFTREGRLYADGNVVATQLTTGSSFSGPNIEYYRATPERPVSRVVAPSRSIARLIEKDSSGKPAPPVTITANRFEDAGDSLLMAWGDVVMNRQAINARSDSAAFDKITQKARLVRAARIVNEDSAKRFVLTGDTIDLYYTDRQLDRVFAMHKATATSENLLLAAERIDLRLVAQQLNEAVAYGTGRAKATTPQQDVEADSLRIRMADKRVREVRAVGSARALGATDSTKIRTTERDMLMGDSVFAFFDSTQAASDTSQTAKVKEIHALGNASSLFHIASSKGPTAPPGINYVRGARIFVHFDTGSVRDVRVDSAASGIYIEPEPDSLSDSTKRAAAGAKGAAGAKPEAKPAAGTVKPPIPTTPVRRPPPDGSPATVPASATDSSAHSLVTRRRQ
jgi:lipopolysaccharide export system protein LptA